MNLLDLFVTIKADDQASSKIGNISQNLRGKLASAAKVGIAAMGAATAAAGSGAVAVGKMAVDSYAEYEQLAGGVDKLFGSSSDKLKRYAQDAYKTSGMSANDYMTQATSFSAALINSLGGDTEKAADQADKAMRLMSDNVNTFGSNSEDVQNAIMGLSRENYTMLDNLKLGYAGTKEGMSKLIDDANAYAASIGQSSNLQMGNFSDMIDAIQLIQEKQNIAGTTAKEAATTIEGSITMTKAAWANLLTEFGKDDGDVSKRVEELVDSAKTTLLGSVDEKTGEVRGGILPRVQKIFSSIAEALPKAMPSVIAAIDGVIPVIVNSVSSIVPMLLQIIMSIAASLVKSIPSVALQLIDAIQNMAPSLLEAGRSAFSSLVQSVSDTAPALFAKVVELVKGAVSWIANSLPAMIRAGADMVRNFTDGMKGSKVGEAAKGLVTEITGTLIKGVPDLLAAWGEWFQATSELLLEMLPIILETVVGIISSIISQLAEMLPSLIDTVVNIISSIVTTLLEHVPDILQAVSEAFVQLLTTIADNLPTIIESIVNGFIGLLDTIITTVTEHGPDLLMAAGEFIGKIGAAIIENLPKIIQTLVEGLLELIGTVVSKAPEMLAAGAKLIGKLPEAILAAGKGTADAVGNVVQGAIDAIGGFLEGAAKAGSDLATSIGQGIKDFADDPVGAVQDLASDAVEKAKSFAEGMQEAGGNLVDAIKDGIGDKGDGPISAVQGAVSDAVETAKGFAEDMYEAGSELWGEITDAIADPDKTVADVVGEHISDFANDIGDFVQKMAQAGADLVGGLVNGIANNFWQVGDAITGGLDQAVNDALNFLGIASPSKLFKWIGEMTMKGGEEGLEKNAYRLADAMGDAMDGMYGAVDDGVVDFQIEAHAIEQSIEAMRRLNMERERSLMLLNETAMAQRSAGVDAGIGGASQIVINVNDPIIKEEADVDKIFDYVQTRVRRQASIWAQSPSMA